MKKYLTPRNIGIAVAAIIVILLLWPKKKTTTTVTTTVVPPATPAPVVPAVQVPVAITPVLAAREQPPVQGRQELFQIGERQTVSGRQPIY